MDQSSRTFHFNGIDATTGRPLQPPLCSALLARLAKLEKQPTHQLADLVRWRDSQSKDHLDARYGIDVRRLEETGWGVVFPADGGPELDRVREALAPLLVHRQGQAGGVDPRFYRELSYQPGESKAKFLARHGAGPGPADPENLPYYLLIVGSPAQIPFSFQYQINLQYAVGRLHFDTAQEYAQYAESVVAAETGFTFRDRRAVFFGVSNDDDPATETSRRQLIEPLSDRIQRRHVDWIVESRLGAEATKAELGSLLGGEQTPALLFTASHGIGFPAGHPRQRSHQGALLCQDWPGPKSTTGGLSTDHYLAAEDIPVAAQLAGLITFHFSCFGTGTPRYDGFSPDQPNRSIAPEGFVSPLPQRLLSHPRGGALAVVGHVDRAWSYSFEWTEGGSQTQLFEGALHRMMDGYPIGAALEQFGQRYAELVVDLNGLRADMERGKSPDYHGLASLWTAKNDARSYTILGDPAVRLQVNGTTPAPS